jgi:hypothetical protein
MNGMLILEIAIGVALAPLMAWMALVLSRRIVWFCQDVRDGGPERTWLLVGFFAVCLGGIVVLRLRGWP